MPELGLMICGLRCSQSDGAKQCIICKHACKYVVGYPIYANMVTFFLIHSWYVSMANGAAILSRTEKLTNITGQRHRRSTILFYLPSD